MSDRKSKGAGTRVDPLTFEGRGWLDGRCTDEEVGAIPYGPVDLRYVDVAELGGGDGDVMVPCDTMTDRDGIGCCISPWREVCRAELEAGLLCGDFMDEAGTANASSANFSVTR